MKKMTFLLFAAVAMIFTACEGPEGPAGPAGSDGSDANFTTFETSVVVADWAGGAYVEFPVDIITEDIYNDGVVLVYIKDAFEYWNQIPSAWTNIVGFSYFWSADTQGVLGLDHNPDVAPAEDYDVRVVTMFMRDFEQIDEEIVADYDRLIDHLENK